jgi:DNA repair exonuclease SbcCD ATPase subunit
MTTTSSEKEGNKKLLIVGLIIVLLSINGILFYMQHQKKQENEEQAEIIRVKNTELEDQIKRFEDLKTDFERQKQELQAMGLTNDSLENRIATISSDLNNLRSFRKSSFSLADQRKYRERASNLEKQLKQKDEEIAKLKEDNKVLFTENTALKSTQTSLSDTLTTMRRTQRDLSDKVALASRLEAQNINVSIINNRGKEKEDKDEEYRAKRVDKIKISFNLAKNEVATKEPKDIMMRLIEPDGAALYNLATGSGTFDFDGKETFYTAKKEIVYDNSQQPVTFTYSKGSEYKRGQHTVEIYSGGYLIGKTNFTLK